MISIENKSSLFLILEEMTHSVSHSSYRQTKYQNAGLLTLNMELYVVNQDGYFTIWDNNHIFQRNLFSLTLWYVLLSSKKSFNTNFPTQNKESRIHWDLKYPDGNMESTG